jgi:hypothetical protein
MLQSLNEERIRSPLGEILSRKEHEEKMRFEKSEPVAVELARTIG